MISKIKENFANCVSESLRGQEKGKEVNISLRNSENAIKIKVDGCLIKNNQRCDCLYIYEGNSKKRIFLVELKGTHYDDALNQLSSTLSSPEYLQIRSLCKSFKTEAVAIVGEKAKINRPSKESWEDKNNIRLHIKPLQENKSFDLKDIIK